MNFLANMGISPATVAFLRELDTRQYICTNLGSTVCLTLLSWIEPVEIDR